MCPYRVLIIFFSFLIAIIALLVALYKEEMTDEQLEAERIRKSKEPPQSYWMMFLDFWTGRYLYRQLKSMGINFNNPFDKQQSTCHIELIEDDDDAAATPNDSDDKLNSDATSHNSSSSTSASASTSTSHDAHNQHDDDDYVRVTPPMDSRTIQRKSPTSAPLAS